VHDPGLLLGAGVLLGSLLSYGMATALLAQLVARLLRNGYAGVRLWKNVLVMTVVALTTAAMHLTQIALWAVILLGCGEVASLAARQ
jgi:hypothetical protein